MLHGTSVAGSVIYYLHGTADLPAAAVLAGMALCTVRLGAKYCCFLPELTLKKYFGFFLLFVALLLILKPFLPYVMEGSSPAWIRWIVLVLLGALTGFISGMMGVGGGSFMIPMMVLFAGIAQHTAQGISLLAMIPASTVGAWTHWERGNIQAVRLLLLQCRLLLPTHPPHLIHYLQHLLTMTGKDGSNNKLNFSVRRS